jgi:hypothetical protein
MIRTVGTPKVTNSSLTRVFNLQNIDNSTTAKFVIDLNVPDMIYSPDVSFVYFVTVKGPADQQAVTYESDRVYFTVTGVSTPTPIAAPTPTPSQTPTNCPQARRFCVANTHVNDTGNNLPTLELCRQPEFQRCMLCLHFTGYCCGRFGL